MKTQPAIPRGPLALVPNYVVEMHSSTRGRNASDPTNRGPEEDTTNDSFGDIILKKEKNTLRIGFQNIGGVPIQQGKHKDDIIKNGITKLDFDIFGIAEVNVNWTHVSEEHRLVNRSRHWWASSHFASTHNKNSTTRATAQYGGVAMWSIDKAAHRVTNKGQDPSGLGRWVWVRYRGKNNITLRIFTAYRPNPPSEGPFTVYAQHRSHFNSIADNRCPRIAFVEDLMIELQDSLSAGDNIIIMLDGNEDMRSGLLHDELCKLNFKEAIIDRHGNDTPSTFDRNTRNVPIDGIWCTPSLQISAGGYLPFDEVFEKTNHRTLWIDLSYIQAFGYNMFPIIKYQARRLKCNDPRCVANYNRRYEQFIQQHNLLQKAQELEAISTFPPSNEYIKIYEEMDQLRRIGTHHAEKKCRKLRMGQVDFSPTIQRCMRAINTWALLIKKAKGGKVSSRMLARSLKKANISSHNRIMGLGYLQEQLHSAYKAYYQAKGNHASLRISHMHTLAEAQADKNNTDKQKILQQLIHQETQRRTA